MIRAMRWLILPAALVAGLVFFAPQAVQADGGQVYGQWGWYDVADSYPSYPRVGSYVDHYDHAAAWAWEGGRAAYDDYGSNGAVYRTGRAWGRHARFGR